MITTTDCVCNVTPGDPNTTCRHCHNLQHYLFNTTKYFTSNTELLFLPGLHHLHTDLIIQNVHNISLIGSTTNGTTPDTVIQCNSSVGIVMTNITDLIVTNITVRNCLGTDNVTVLIKLCTNVQLRHIVLEESHNSYGIIGINVLGDSRFSYITNNAIRVVYTDATIEDKEIHSLIIDHHYNDHVNSKFTCKVIIDLLQQSYRVNLLLLHLRFQRLTDATAIDINLKDKGLQQNFILVKYCQFFKNDGTLINITVVASSKTEQGEFINVVQFDNCHFSNNHIIGVSWHNRLFNIMYDQLNLQITNSYFYNNKINIKCSTG